MDDLDKIKKRFIDGYESTLSIEGDEICKEVYSLISDDFDLMREKARAYCYLCTVIKKGVVDTKLHDKCKKYLKHLRYYEEIKSLSHIIDQPRESRF